MRGVIAMLGVMAALVLAGCGAGSSTSSTSSSSRSIEAAKIPQPPVPSPGSCHARDGGALPDPACTPGAVDPAVTAATAKATVCVSGYTAKVRPPVSYTEPLKLRLMAAYGMKGSPADYELDHLVSLEIGGAPAAVENLWPERYAPPNGARVKDAVENASRRVVCADPSRLRLVQHAIATDWETDKLGGG